MNDREILTAVLRWHTIHELRLAASAKLYAHRKAAKQAMGHFPSDYYLSLNVTEAKRIERAALRVLAKVCAKVRGNQRHVSEADVIDLSMLLMSVD
jgi:hypothetical protein